MRVLESQPALETWAADHTDRADALDGLPRVVALQKDGNPVVRQERRLNEPQRCVAIDLHSGLTAS
jgi:hypothetical protein